MEGFRAAVRLLCLAVISATALLAGTDAAGAVTVTKTADSKDGKCDADCSLREAIEAAAPGETVTVPASATPYEVLDANGTLLIQKDLTIAGAGARQTEVTAPGISERPFTILSPLLESATVTIRDLSITGGNGFGGGFGGQGGGVLAVKDTAIVGPQLTLERVRIAGNTATTSGAQAVGGGVTADGEGTHLTVRESLITDNEAQGLATGQATGGGLATFAKATATIENSTIVNNRARAEGVNAQSALGGGIALGGASSVLNSTIAQNSALHFGAGVIEGRGGNLNAQSTVTIRNNIVTGGAADQAGTGDCTVPITSQSQGGNVLPATCGPAGGDRTASDPRLEPLANNGGETDTMALLSDSPGLDAGVGCPPPTVDQRGMPRPSGAGCDSGAFELQIVQPAPPPATPTPPICGGKKATIVGTTGRDRLRGTKKRDVIAALAGNDTILSFAGNDLICAGKGKDVVKGGPGKDRLLGQKGADRLFGGPGKDKLLGGAGKDLQIQ